MRLLTQDEAKIQLAKLKLLGQVAELNQQQAIEAIELLDNLQYSYRKQAHLSENPASIQTASCELEQVRDELANKFNICTCCYQPFCVCICDLDWVETLCESDNPIYDDIG